MQRGNDPRVSDPVIETMELARPTTRISGVTGVRADVEPEVTAAYDEYAHRLRAFAISATRDGDLADDLLQETFLRLVVELKAGRRPSNLGGWLYRVCANLIVSRGRHRTVAERARAWLLPGDAAPSPEQETLAHERDRTLALALSKLPAEMRVALLLAARGMGSTEIGLAIRRSPGATRTYLCRARVRLRDELSALGHGPDR